MQSTAIKVIVMMGVLAFLFLGLASVGLKRYVHSSGTVRVAAGAAKSPFDGKRAFEDLRRIVALGPRIPGSEALAQERVLIRGELERSGLRVEEHAFDAKTPIGDLRMVNLVGVVEGTRPGIILLGNHYDTKYFKNIVFVGANDGGSTAAWMIEMARALGPKRTGYTVWLCFFDGEEAFGTWSATDSLYGSRAFVEHLRADGTFAQVKAMVNVDMIGDCFLGIKQDRDAPGWLTAAVWGAARDLGYTSCFLPFADSIEDDHVPFRRAGIPAMDIIDFSYGGGQIEHARNWHTAKDTLDRVCPDSLQVVGDVIYHALPKIDAHLDSTQHNDQGKG